MLSIYIIVGGSSILGFLVEWIGFKVKNYKMNKRRPGRRLDMKTRIQYKLESIVDYLITPR